MGFGTFLKAILSAAIQMIKFLSFIIIPAIILIIIILILFLYHFCINRFINQIKPKKKIKRTVFEYKNKKYIFVRPFENHYKEPSIIKKVFYYFPKQLSYDFLNRNPNAFTEYGIHMVCGKQGSGKTVTVVYLLDKWRQMFPNLQIYTNMDYKYENGELTHWKELLLRNNGIYGVVNVIDEIHTWFSNKESKDLPPEVLGEISQQRKQKKCIIGTAQVFGKIAKPLREQTHFVYLPYTFFGVLTVVRMAEATDYDTEKNKFKKYKGFFFFVHNKIIRESYDTYKRISRYVDTEFSDSGYYSKDN